MEDGYWHLWIFGGVWICVGIAGWLAFRYWKSKKDNVTEDDIKTMVDEGHEQGVLETREARMIRNIFELDEKQAGNVMTHRKHITALPGSMTLKEAAQFVLWEGKNTRYPVYGEDLDDIIGMIHMRDVLVHAENEKEAGMELDKVPGVLREAHFIPETRKLDSLFREMQSQKIHMEIVIDEYGQTAGLVTIEDILEEIVGNILDEYDVEEIVRKKYHILKTSDNFYLYKTDIKRWLKEMGEDLPWLEQVCQRNQKLRGVEVQVEELTEQIDLISRGFDDIEHRIMNMDKEHTRYIRATVTRLHYLLNREDNMKGLVIRLLNHLSETEGKEALERETERISHVMNLSQMAVLSQGSLYKKRKSKQDFMESLAEEEDRGELSGEEVLRLNKIQNRYSRREVETFILSRMKDGRMEVTQDTVCSEEDFEKLVLAYDRSSRKDSPFRVREDEEGEVVDNGRFRYPKLVFERKNL